MWWRYIPLFDLVNKRIGHLYLLLHMYWIIYDIFLYQTLNYVHYWRIWMNATLFLYCHCVMIVITSVRIVTTNMNRLQEYYYFGALRTFSVFSIEIADPFWAVHSAARILINMIYTHSVGIVKVQSTPLFNSLKETFFKIIIIKTSSTGPRGKKQNCL